MVRGPHPSSPTPVERTVPWTHTVADSPAVQWESILEMPEHCIVCGHFELQRIALQIYRIVDYRKTGHREAGNILQPS